MSEAASTVVKFRTGADLGAVENQASAKSARRGSAENTTEDLRDQDAPGALPEVQQGVPVRTGKNRHHRTYIRVHFSYC